MTALFRPRGDAGPRACAWVDVLPLAVSVFQFAVAIGAAIAASDVDPGAALAGTALLSAGSAQLAAIGLVDAGAGVVVAVTTVILINLRFMVYGAGFARWFADEPRWRRFAMVYPIVDQTYVLCERRFAEHCELGWRRTYYLTVVVLLFASLLAGEVLGFVAGDLVPDAAGLHLAAPIVFVGLLAMTISGRSKVVGAGVAAATILVATGMPGGFSLPVAAAVGICAATWIGERGDGEADR